MLKRTFIRFGASLGKFLYSLTSLMLALGVYLIFCIITFVLLRLYLDPNQNPDLVTYIIATGGDVDIYLPILRPHSIAFYWILVFHITSWLIVPVLAAATVDGAYRLYEQRKEKAVRNIEVTMVELLKLNTSLGDDEIGEIVRKEIKSWKTRLERR
jgi:hypothetical protein